MRAFVTGATGFIGGDVARKLRTRGDDVVALVRSRAKASSLEEIGCELVAGDLTDREALKRGLSGCDAAFHIAAMYKVGVMADECRQMHEANVDGTRNVLAAAVEAGVSRIVYVSTIGYFGNTEGNVIDETFERTNLDWLSCYDETKYLAHRVAAEFIASGAPVLIALPGGVYGPGDQSDLATLVKRIRSGWMKALVMKDTGFNWVHVDDASDGIILVHDKGTVGESYALGGELSTMGDFITKIATLSGRTAPKREIPVGALKAVAPLGRVIGPLIGIPPNVREMIKAGNGVTYWATDAKARRELGYSPRDLETGLKEMLAAS